MITVRFFAMLREAAGAESLRTPAPRVGTVRGLVDELVAAHPGLAEPFGRRRILVAVNRHYADMDSAIGDGDEVAFLPPVSGG